MTTPADMMNGFLTGIAEPKKPIERGDLATEAAKFIGLAYQHRGQQIEGRDMGYDFLTVIGKAYENAFHRPFIWEAVPDYEPDGFFLGEGGWLDAILMECGFRMVETYPLERGDILTFNVEKPNPFYHAAIFEGTDGRNRPCVTHAYWGRSCTSSFYDPFWSRCLASAWRYEGAA